MLLDWSQNFCIENIEMISVLPRCKFQLFVLIPEFLGAFFTQEPQFKNLNFPPQKQFIESDFEVL